MLGSIKAALAAAATSIKSALPTVVAATTATVLTGGCIYYYTIKDGIYEKREDNVRYVLEEYISQISTESIMSDGNGGYAYSTDLDKTVEDIVNKLKEAGSNISEYTGKNNEEEILSKFIKAEIITQFPDLRNEDAIRKGKKVGENELQGGIKIIRKDSNTDTSSSSSTDITYVIGEKDQILTYIPYSEFSNKITNNDENVKKHFSIKSSGTDSVSIDIVVAGWTEEKTTVTKVEYIPNNDGTKDEKKEYEPEVTTTYTFNEISINYQNTLSKYSMPAGFLWSLLVMGESTTFVEKLADLAINNTEIIIEAQDNVTTTVNTNEQRYMYKKDVTKTVVSEDGTTKIENSVATAQKESSITTTVETKQSNTSLNLTYAETWVATYKKDYKNTVTNEKIDKTEWINDAEWTDSEDINLETDIEVSENANDDKEYEELKAKIIEEITEEKCKELLTSKIGNLKNTNTLYYVFSWDAENENKIYNKSVDYMYNYIKSGFIEEFLNNITIKKEMGEYITDFWDNKSKEVENIYTTNKIEKSNIIDDLYNMLKDISDNIITLTSAQTTVINQKVENKSATNIQTANTNTYTSAGTNVQERIDIDKENNFVAYFNKSKRAREYILQSPDWLYEMLESHEKTANMVDLFKYLLYQATEQNYGVTSFDFSVYDLSSMKQVSSGSGFWWPIGSMETTMEDGKLFASGAPALGKNNISRMGATGSAYGITVNKHTGNLGLDVGAGGKTNYYNVISIGEGVVTIVKDGVPEGSNPNANGGCGNYVAIDYGNGLVVRFLHLYAGTIKVSIGETVTYGQVLGKVGHNGNSTGPHLHMDIKLNGVFVDPTKYVDPDNPRPQGVGGISSGLYNFLISFEGGTGYYNQSTGEYTVFNNGLDNNLELTCGVAIGTKSSGTYAWVNEILGRTVTVGDKITKEEYDKIFAIKVQGFISKIDAAIAQTGVILTQQQRDAAFSLCWNTGNIKNAITRFKENGEKGYWEYMHDITNSGLEGLVRRRGEEMEMFLDGDYAVGSVNYGITKHREYNTKYGLPINKGE